MGVATGALEPTVDYEALRPEIDRLVSNASEPNWSVLSLKMIATDGSAVDGVGGIVIFDFVGNHDFAPEVTVAGLDCGSGLYEKWFREDPAYRAYCDLDE